MSSSVNAANINPNNYLVSLWGDAVIQAGCLEQGLALPDGVAAVFMF